jgi:AcrR family transcriptional regulator
MQNTSENQTLEVNARQRLLETATELFAEKGYAGTSVREIVEKAGVSKPVLYYYFKSKDGLFYAVLEWAVNVQQKILNEIFESKGTVLDRFIIFYRRVYEGVRQYQSLYIMIHGLIYGPPQGVPEYDFAKYQRQMLDAYLYRRGFVGRNQESRCGGGCVSGTGSDRFQSKHRYGPARTGGSATSGTFAAPGIPGINQR